MAAASLARRPEPRVSFVYDGPALLGRIVLEGPTFAALDAGGKKLGEFSDTKSAMRAICASARAERLQAHHA